MKAVQPYETLLNEMAELRSRLNEAEETIEAIRTGQVDALVVADEKGHQLFTIKSADQTFRFFIEKMKEGAVTLNLDGRIVYCNSRFASMVTLPLAKVTGMRLRDFIPGHCQEAYDELIAKGWLSDSKGEMPIQNTDGEEFQFLLSVTSLQLSDGAALSIILTDLTGPKEVERELKLKNDQLEEAQSKVSRINEELESIVKERTRDLSLSREHFRFLAENIPVIVWTTNADGTMNYYNKRWYDYTGLTLENMPHGMSEIMEPGVYDKSLKIWKKAVEEEIPYVFEFKLRRSADKCFRWHRSHATPFKDEQGNIITWLGTTLDIEDQKQELQKKDEFIGVASHELKTPLTSLKGYVQLIGSQEKLPVMVNQYVKKANTSLEKLQHLINDLLDVSKIQAGKLKFITERLDLSEIMLSWIDNAKHIYPDHDISSEIETGIFVNGNGERLEQVLMNMVSNAVKYSPSKKDIVIALKKGTGKAIVSVTDSGIGLSVENQQRIFERFFRVDDHLRQTSGLGMGLYISAEIIKEHSGMMSVKSSLGNGATFSFALPLIK